MNKQDENAVELVGNCIRGGDDAHMKGSVSISGGRRLYFRIGREPPKWARFLREIWEWTRNA